MPLYEVVLEQRYFDQQIIERFNYVGTGTPASVSGSFGLLTGLGLLPTSTTLATGTLGAAIQGIQNGAAIFVQALARAVYIDEDFYTVPFLANTIGQVGGAGDPMSPVAAFGFRSNRVKQSIGRGFKRFVGMSEGDVDSGGVLSAGAITRCGTLRTRLGETVTYDDEGNTLTFTPCIVQKKPPTVAPVTKGYAYYPTEAEQAPHLAQGITWEIYNQMRTQRSRQYGHGA